MDNEWCEEFSCPIVNGVLAPAPISWIPPEEPIIPRRVRRREGDEELFFELFKFPGVEKEYLLEVHEVDSGNVTQYRLVVYDNENKWKLKIYDFNTRDHGLEKILEDPNPLTFHKKYDLPLQQRLVGWTLEIRQRSTGKEDTFYYHQGRQFRSLVETATFVLYSTNPNELNLVNPPHQAPAS